MTQPIFPRLLSVNVGLPRSVLWKGRTVVTGIFKEPVTGPVVARRLNLDGDRQADLSVHGGADKAIYVYPAEHYGPWQQELEIAELPRGMFGENLSTQGFTENTVVIGERWRVGQAVLMVTQPRQPCYKLGVRFGRDDVLSRLVRSRRTGWYVAVLRGGAITAGDPVLIERPADSLTVAAVADLLFAKEPDRAHLRLAATLPTLAADLRMHFQKQLAQKYR